MRLELDGERLRDARLEARFSRRALAEETARLDPANEGVSAGMIEQYERGKRSGISAEKLQLLAEVLAGPGGLGIEPADLLTPAEVASAALIAAGKG